MNRLTVSGITCAVLGIATLLLAQTGQPTQSAATVNQEGTRSSMAAPAGKDRELEPSRRRSDQSGPFRYGDLEVRAGIQSRLAQGLNPVKLKMCRAARSRAHAFSAPIDTYCAMANAGTTSLDGDAARPVIAGAAKMWAPPAREGRSRRTGRLRR